MVHARRHHLNGNFVEISENSCYCFFLAFDGTQKRKNQALLEKNALRDVPLCNEATKKVDSAVLYNIRATE